MAYNGSKPLKYSCTNCGVKRYFQTVLCAECNHTKKKSDQAKAWIDKLTGLGYRVYSDLSKMTNKDKADVENLACGHRYHVRLLNLLNQRSICSICGPKKRMAYALEFFKAKYVPDDPTDFARFKRKVRNLTEQTYKANIDTINPLRLKRSRPDVDPNAYQLDHKVSIFEAYRQGWTPEAAAALENLQMLPAIENFQKQRFNRPS